MISRRSAEFGEYLRRSTRHAFLSRLPPMSIFISDFFFLFFSISGSLSRATSVSLRPPSASFPRSRSPASFVPRSFFLSVHKLEFKVTQTSSGLNLPSPTFLLVKCVPLCECPGPGPAPPGPPASRVFLLRGIRRVRFHM